MMRRRYVYGTDSRGVYAHWYREHRNRAAAEEAARSMVRYPGDRAVVYRKPVTRWAVGASDAWAVYWAERRPDTGAVVVYRGTFGSGATMRQIEEVAP